MMRSIVNALRKYRLLFALLPERLLTMGLEIPFQKKGIQGERKLWVHYTNHSWDSFPVWEVWWFLLHSRSEEKGSQVGSPCRALNDKCENRFAGMCCCFFSFTTGKACLDGKVSFAMRSAFESAWHRTQVFFHSKHVVALVESHRATCRQYYLGSTQQFGTY